MAFDNVLMAFDNIISSQNSKFAKNNLDSYVNLIGYTQSWYTFPEDGYVHVYCNSAGNINVLITGANGNNQFSVACSRNNSDTNIVQACFVKKGMKLKVYADSGVGAVRYYKLIP